MPQLGLGTEIGRVSGGAYDSDALAYFARAGIASGTQTPSSYDNAASFNGTNQFLSIPSNSTLAVTGTSFTFAFWANAVNTTSIQIIFNKSNPTGIEYRIMLTAGLLRFLILPDGVTWETRKEIDIGAGAVNTWNFYVCRYDSSGGGTMGISINGGAFTSLGSVGAITQTLSNTWQIANWAEGVTYSLYTGQLSSIGFWKKALTASEVTALWNNGAGRTYASLDSGLRNNLVSWWALNQNSVTADSHGTNTLTNNGTPLVTATTLGPIITGYSDSRRLISDFVRGIKSLGLWNSMVCWPLRASQNAGGGTTAFSLGGLGQFNGTLVNAPTWGANGMTFLLASAQGISATVGNLTLAEQSLFAVSRTPVINAGQVLIARNSTGGTQNGMNLRTNEATAIAGGIGDIGVVQQAGGSTLLNIINSKDTNFSGYAVASNITNARLKRFPSTESADTALAFTGNLTNTDPLWIGRRSAAAGTGDCTIPFASMFTRDIRSSWDQVYSLYRQTLGLGLGLP
jgi:hypothetical protein